MISNKETALLGLLNEKPMHPYQIEKVVKERDMRYWTEISMSSIYKLLNKLEENELVKSRVELTKKNIAQKIYHLTKKGKEALREKVRFLLSEPEKMIWQIDLATSNLNILSQNVIRTCIVTYKKNIENSIKCYKELEKYLIQNNCPVSGLALAKRPQYLYEGELKWIEDYLNKLNNKN